MTILGIHSGALGDVVLFGQFLDALRDKRGGRVRLVAGGEKGKLLAGLGVVDEALDFDSLPMEQVFSAAPAGRCDLPGRLGECELLVSCFAAGNDPAQRRLEEFTSARESLFLPVRPPAGCDGHMLDIWAAQAGLDGVSPPTWSAPEQWRRNGCRALRGLGVDPARPYVLIHPGAGGQAKCWPLENFIELAAAISSLGGTTVAVFVVGPTELDWWGQQTIAALQDRFPTLICPPLSVLAAVAAEAGAYVGNDSGPTHLAAAVGAAVVALFGLGATASFAPRGRRVAVLDRQGLGSLSVGAVLTAMESI